MDYVFNEQFSGAGLTDVGIRRSVNQDNFLIDTHTGLLIVADGIGGHNAGEVASAYAISIVRNALLGGLSAAESPGLQSGYQVDDITLANMGDYSYDTSSEDSTHPDLNPHAEYHRVADAIAKANRMINGLNHERGYDRHQAMGTTIIGLYFPQDRPMDGIVFHVGDSRMYRFRDGVLTQITRDHSAYEGWLDNDRKGPMPSKNVILRAIGPVNEVTPSLRVERFLPNDMILMCSDGLSDLVPDGEIKAILSTVNADNLTAGCQKLVDTANAKGGTDNITVVLGAFSSAFS